jgi:hypothetical protein
MNAPRPATISRPGKVTWHAWPAITRWSQWSSQAIAILHLVLVAAVLCRILGLSGHWGEGAVFPPPRLPLLNDGPVDPGSASSGTNSRAVFWGAVRAPGVCGCWGAVPCGASSPPLLLWPCVGLVFFLLWGDLPNMSSLVHKLSYLNSAHGCGGTVRRLQFYRDCHMGSIAGWPPWRRRKIQARVSDDIPAACIRELRVFSLLLRTCGDLRGL